MLLVESGSRYLVEDLLPGVYKTHPEIEQVDLLTCFPGMPKTFDTSRGSIFRVTDYPGRQARESFFRELKNRRYSVCGILCTGEPVMTKWKWAAALRLSGKVFILNENGDYFWLDRGNLGILRHFVLFRMGLTGSSAIGTIAGLLLFPFTFTYLLLFAAYIHLRRWARS